MRALATKLEERHSSRNFALGAVYLSPIFYPGLIFDGLRSPKDQCVLYYRRYSHKGSCFRDIQMYVSELSKEDQATFIREIEIFSDESEVHSITSISLLDAPPKALQRHQLFEVPLHVTTLES